MRNIKILLYAILFSISILSCEEKSEVVMDDLKKSDYDEMVFSLAKAINAAVRENEDYRLLIKDEVSKLYDGDYDYLLSTSMGHTVTPSDILITRSSCNAEITVKELLSYYLNTSSISTKSSLDYLDDIINQYPELQISVPVHAEGWDPELYIPSVAIIPEDCEYMKTKTLPGIDAEGKEIEIDAINEPEVPVIVVGLSERMIGPPIIDIDQPSLNVASITLTGVFSNGAMRLEYCASSNVTSINSVDIYRTKANSAVYEKIASCTEPPTFNTYNDWAIEDYKEYSYYIRASCVVSFINGEATTNVTSNVITLIADSIVPNSVTNLRSRNEYSTKNFITWDNPEMNIYPTQIFKTTPNMTNRLIATLNPTETYYYDDPVIKGEKWIYLVKKLNPNTGSVSPHKQTFVYNPYRNPSKESKVMLRKILLDRTQIEGWFEGRPEVYITTYGHIKLSNGDIIVDTLSTVDYRFPAGSNGTSEDLSSLLADWSFFDDSSYYPVINIHAVEYDRGNGSFDFSTSAKIGLKLSDDIVLESKGNFNYVFSNDAQDCGVAYLRYYQNPCDTLDFPNYEFKLILSE